jgi:membrane protease YdiL (CAAX protease family)
MTLKGVALGCAGIAILGVMATLAGATQWNFKLPAFLAVRTWSNLILTSIPQEGFWRGFLQRTLSSYFHDSKMGKWIALFVTSILFTLDHIYWSPNGAILGFVFLASLLYGAVYLFSKRIESAILTHFLLNLIHMTFFEYHAM